MKIKLYISAFLLFMAGLANAQLKDIYTFSKGEEPQSALTPSGNMFYGVGSRGGANNKGCIFSVMKDGSNYKDLWDFKDTGTALHANGAYPHGCSLTLSGHKLYGATAQGGSNEQGVIFSINTDGSGYKDLWDFNDTGSYIGNANGQYPLGGLVLVRNKLYGVTNSGGYHNSGMIFSIDTNGSGFKDILDFSQTINGGSPEAALILSGGKLFGTTYGGDCIACREESYDYGNVFSIDTDGTHYKDIYVFAGPNGANPEAVLTLSQNGKRLYGTTYDGGPYYNNSYGTIFGVDTSGDNFKTLLNFNKTNGSYTSCALTLSGSKLYGEGSNGGGYFQYVSYGYGNVFSIDTNGNNFSTIYNFDLIHGEDPYNDKMVLEGDSLYGIASYGGFDDNGVVFACLDSVTPSGVQNIAANNSGVSVYPNPSSGQFTVSIKNYESGITNQVEVYNVMGQEVYSQANISNSTFNIDLGSQANGIYLYRIISFDGNTVGEGKVVLQK